MMINATARKSALLAAGAVTALAAAGQANAAAFYLQEQSTKAVGRAFSGEVSEMGAQQMWWNPASIGGIDTIENYVGFTAILPKADATNTGTTVHRPGIGLSGLTGIPGLPAIAASDDPVGGNQTVHDMVNKGYLPNGGFAMPLPGGFAFGFTMTSPYSFTTNYGKNDWTRYSADKSRLRTLDFQPALAWGNGHISIGAAPNIEYVRATLSNYLPDPLANLSGIPVLGPTLAGELNTGDGHQYLKGSGWDVGYSFGFQFHNDKADIGVSYKSAIKHHLKGHLIVDGLTGLLAIGGANQRVDGADARFTTPWQVNFGARFHLTPRLTVEGQVTRFGWDKFNSIDLSGLGNGQKLNASDPTPSPIQDQSIKENYKNAWSFAAGFDYKLSRKLTWRAGVQRDLSPVITGYRDPRVPDGNRWNFATGASYEMTDHMGIDLAASYDKIKSVKIDSTTSAYVGSNPDVQTEITNSGDLYNAHALVFSMGGHLTF